MSVSPLISVVMAVYNGECYLHESIQSILNQTYSNFEFIIINDGSTDLSPKIINRYANDDLRIITINQENKGLSYSLNAGLRLAKGKYIARMDADDISMLNRLELQVAALEENSGYGLCQTLFRMINEDGRTIVFKKRSGFRFTPMQTRWTLLWRNCVAHPTVMLRRDVVTKNNLAYDNNAIGCEDYDLWTRLSQFTDFVTIPEPLLQYRRHSKSVTCNYGEKHIRNFARVISANLKPFTGIQLESRELRELVVLTRQTHLMGKDVTWQTDTGFFINLVEQVMNEFNSQNNLDDNEKIEVRCATSYLYFRWAQQALPRNKSMAVRFCIKGISHLIS